MECNDGIDCECGGMVREGGPTLRQKFKSLLRDECARTRSDGWMQMVEQCTSRKITKQTDRLPTLSGVAKFLQGQGYGEYLAGLWKEHLPAQLLWSAGGPKACRADSYRAPTWSFASVENASVSNRLEKLFRTNRDFLVVVMLVPVTLP